MSEKDGMTRRTFLKGAGYVAARAAMPNLTKPPETPVPPNTETPNQTRAKIKAAVEQQKKPELTQIPETAYQKGNTYYSPNGNATPSSKNERGLHNWSPDLGQIARSLPPEETVYNPAGLANRSPEAFLQVINHYHVDDPNNGRYRPTDENTFCNFYLWDVTNAFGIGIPHYGENNDYMTANKTFDYLEARENRMNWAHFIDTTVAQELANQGVPVVVAVKNHTGGSGHVGILFPNHENDGKTHLVQAGRINGIVEVTNETFPTDTYSTPEFYVNTQDYGDE
jgi:hypothetical protein